MINKIKIEYCQVAKDIMGNRFYTPVDITKYCNLPLIYGKNLDDELDMSNFEMDIGTQTPLEPSTRVIIRLNEKTQITTEPTFNDEWVVYSNEKSTTTKVWAVATIKGCKKIYSYSKTKQADDSYVYSELNKQLAIYRIIQNDTPKQIISGKFPKWKHYVSLLEPTKVLERQDCDNETITHTIAANAYDTVKETVNYNSTSSHSGLGSIKDNGYIGSVRFKKPYRQGDAMPLNVRLKIKGMAGYYTGYGGGMLVIGIGRYNEREDCTLSLQTLTITKPNGQSENIDLSQQNYTFDSSGTYKIKQIYRGSGENSYTFTATWEIIVFGSSSPSITKKTITGVIDKLLSTTPLRREGLQSPYYQLKESLREPLNEINAPEFTFTFGHLMDNLSQVGGFIHAIPRIVPNEFLAFDENNVPYINDWQNWNIVDFDFLGENIVFSNNEQSAKDGEWSIDDYATNFVTNVANAVQTNCRTYSSSDEPFNSGFISPRTESADFIVTDNNCVIKVNLPIYAILNVKCYNGEDIIDITGHVVEFNKYQTLSAYNSLFTTDGKVCKANTIYYTKGEKTIKGLNFEAQTELDVIQGLLDKTAIRNILNGYSGNIKDLAFRVTYIPYRNFKARQYKPLITNNENSSLFYNQQANVIDIEAYGESVKGALLRTGNPIYVDTFYFNSFEDIPEIGMVRSDGYYIYSIVTEIYNNLYKSTIRFSKDFNKLNEYVGIKSDYRQYEISENDSSNRNPDYGEFCILSTESDTLEIEQNQNNDYATTTKDYLSNLGLQNLALEQIKNKLAFICNNGVQGQQISWVYIETESVEYDTDGNGTTIIYKSLLPISCFSFGNSFAIHFKSYDNYAIGTTLKDLSGAKALEEYQQYSDFYGHIDTMKLAFGVGLPANNLGETKTYSKKLCNFENYTLNEDNIIVDFREYPFWLDKDSREMISFTYQLHFVTNSSKIHIGKSLSEIWGFVGDTTSTLKIVEFYKMPSKFENNVSDLTTFIEPEYNKELMQNNDYKRIQIKAPTQSNSNCIGWGILTNNNDIVVTVKGYDDLYLLFRHKI